MRQPHLPSDVGCYNLLKCFHVARGNSTKCPYFWCHGRKNHHQQNDAHRLVLFHTAFNIIFHSKMLIHYFSGFPLNVISLLVTITAIETWGTAMFDLNQYYGTRIIDNENQWVPIDNCTIKSASWIDLMRKQDNRCFDWAFKKFDNPVVFILNEFDWITVLQTHTYNTVSSWRIVDTNKAQLLVNMYFFGSQV